MKRGGYKRSKKCHYNPLLFGKLDPLANKGVQGEYSGESVEQFLKRGGQITKLPPQRGEEETAAELEARL